jgi:hypothetical protein
MPPEPASTEIDRSLAGASTEVRRLVGVLEARAGEGGERQGLADVAALVSGQPPDTLAGRLLAALWELKTLRGALRA